jgi:4-alpha-glucanotransferase
VRFPRLDRNFTGVSIPVASLRTAESCGVGDFGDLAALGRWCRLVRLDVIQILPVNDTGSNSSPYSALSAFALHPLYIRLQEIPGAPRHAAEIERFRAEAARAEAQRGGRFSYPDVLAFKLSLIERLTAENAPVIRADPAFAGWKAANPWVVPYAVFTALKKIHGNAAWARWPADLADPEPAAITRWHDTHADACLSAVWTQFLLEGQLTAACRALNADGVYLKGDLPILMSAESADVWAERRYFDLGATAGAPPDMFSPDGQNWGFPVYDWESLGRDDYRWWKDRLSQAGKFFNAFRIDHVLGFFRIWRIPRGELTGTLGRFSPSFGLSPQDCRALGYDDARVRWLTVPHVTVADLQSLGSAASRVARQYLQRIGSQDLYNLLPAVDGEAAIDALTEPGPVKAFLRDRHADRTLIEESGTYYPAWYLDRKTGFRSMSDPEKAALRGVLGKRRVDSETDWEQRGRGLLAALQAGTDMLVCAEDLGDVPRCVPRVLASLGILGLRIVRWSRAYDDDAPGGEAPFIPPARYSPLSVCTPSVHDTSTVRGWWAEDPGEREQFYRHLGEEGPCPAIMTAPLLRRILEHCCAASSLVCMFQAQDLLDLDTELWSRDPAADRINIPGTISETNWTWRLPVPVEDLRGRPILNESIRVLTTARRARAAAVAGGT